MNPRQPSDAVRATLALVAVTVTTLILGEWLRVSNASIVSNSYLMVVLIVAASSRLWIAVATLIADFLYSVLNPRIRLGSDQ